MKQAVLGFLLGLLAAGGWRTLDCVEIAFATPPTPVLQTTLEQRMWDALSQCRRELDETAVKLEGERAKVRTATTTIRLSCPAIPPCAVDTHSCLLEGGLGALGGAIVIGGFCAALSHGPSVSVVK